MKVKDIIKTTRMEGSIVSVCINQTVDFKIHAYANGKIVLMNLPQEIEKKMLNLEVDAYNIKSYSKERVYINIFTKDINKDGIFIRN